MEGLRSRIALETASHRVVCCKEAPFPVGAPYSDVGFVLINTVACIVPWRRWGHEYRYVEVIKLISRDVDYQIAIGEPNVRRVTVSTADIPKGPEAVHCKVMRQ